MHTATISVPSGGQGCALARPRQDPETDLKLINASYDADYLAYMMK